MVTKKQLNKANSKHINESKKSFAMNRFMALKKIDYLIKAFT